jgi:DNA-binding NarL/FixJ family response regulator
VRTVRVTLQAPDLVTQAGLTQLLRKVPALRLVAPGEQADVRVVVCDRFGSEIASSLRATAAASGPPVVLVVGRISERDLPLAVEGRVVAVHRRSAVRADRLAQDVRVAAAFGTSRSSTLVRRLLKPGMRLEGDRLTLRELDVLSLMAEGLETREIAEELHYSERLVKQLTHRIFVELERRNRSHAVAYALRSGLI